MSFDPGNVITLNGVEYPLDLSQQGDSQFRRQSIDALRAATYQDGPLGEGSVSAEDLWRRDQNDWSHGAGQTWFDRKDSDSSQFRTSLGVNPWVKNQLSTLADTNIAYTQPSPVMMTFGPVTNDTGAVPAGGQAGIASTVWFANSQGLWRNTDTTATYDAYTRQTDCPTTITGITSNGDLVFVATGSGVYAYGAAQSGTYSALNATAIGWARGRLMAAAGNVLYNITTTGAAPSAYYTHPSARAVWTAFAEGPAAIYAALTIGVKSEIHLITVKSDGTGLNPPVLAATIPMGETITAIYGYLGFLLVGTTMGVRVGTLDSAGNITLGALIMTTSPVRCFNGFGRFVYFGLTAFTVGELSGYQASGIGRLDLSVFTQPTLPAYASDLMPPDTTIDITEVRGILTLRGRVVFLTDLALYVSSSTKRSYGALFGGRIGYGLPDSKTALRAGFTTLPAPAQSSAVVTVTTDTNLTDSVFANGVTGAGSSGTQTLPDLNGGNGLTGYWYELSVRLNATNLPRNAPTLTAIYIRARPLLVRSQQWVLPIDCAASVDYGYGISYKDSAAIVNALFALIQAGPISLTVAGVPHQVVVEDVSFLPRDVPNTANAYDGIAVVRAKAFAAAA